MPTKLACRFCTHPVSSHNRMRGCVHCTCLATPGEANPRTEAEVMREALPAPVARIAAERIAPVIQTIVDVHGIEKTIDVFLAELRRALLLQFQERD